MAVINGTAGDDTLVGTSGDDTIIGGAGDDLIEGTGGADALYGGPGSDTFKYLRPEDSSQSAYDTIEDFETSVDKIDLTDMASGAQRQLYPAVIYLYVTGSATTLFAYIPYPSQTPLFMDIVSNRPIYAGDIITGSATTPFYSTGGNKDDVLVGLAGNDSLTGLAGADTLTGGAGADTFLYKAASDSTASATDLITDFKTGEDLIAMVFEPTALSIVRSGGASFIFASTPNGQLQINVNGAVNGGDIDIGFSPYNTRAILIGDDRGDVLTDGALGDTIHGGSGNDLIIGRGGGDALYGGGGADSFKYTSTFDSTASANDIIFDFQSGMDKIDFTALGINHISTVDNGTAEFLFIETTSGAMMQIAAQGVDVIQAGDFIIPGGTNFYMQGDSASNTLIGGAGQDVLDGHAGNDLIIGGGGTDALIGGSGSDTFRYLASTDSTVSAPDTIFDLETGIDKIDLRGVHAAGVGSYGIAYTATASYLFVDVNGDGVNDMLIQVGNPNLHASDLLW